MSYGDSRLHNDPGGAFATARVVSAFLSRNPIPKGEVTSLIEDVHAAIDESRHPRPGRLPAVPVEDSVTRDWVVCLEDGRRLKTLGRYLRVRHGMTVEEYRAKWGLPDDHPMVAPSHSEARSSIAKRNRLGRRGA